MIAVLCLQTLGIHTRLNRQMNTQNIIWRYKMRLITPSSEIPNRLSRAILVRTNRIIMKGFALNINSFRFMRWNANVAPPSIEYSTDWILSPVWENHLVPPKLTRCWICPKPPHTAFVQTSKRREICLARLYHCTARLVENYISASCRKRNERRLWPNWISQR